MPQTIQQADGTEIEVFTAEEVQAKNEELMKATSEASKLADELSKLREKDLNFSKLREQKDDAEKRVDKLKVEMDEKLEQTKKELFEGALKDHYNDALTSLAGDEETKKKIEYHYNRLSDKTTTKQDIDKKLRDAWALSQDKPASSMGAAFSSGGMGYVKPSSTPKTFSKEEVELGKEIARAGGLKLSDEDFK